METLIILTIGTWLKGKGLIIGLTFVFGILASKGLTIGIKKFASKGASISKELGEFFGEGSEFLQSVDKAIREDGSLNQNSIQEVLKEGRDVIAEGRDVVMIIKPKKKELK